MGNNNSRDRPSGGSNARSDPGRAMRPPPAAQARLPEPLPVTTKALSKGADARLAFGVGSMQGWRDSMEDAHAAVLRLPLPAELQTVTEKQFSFFGVYDGHGGDEVSRYLAENLHARIAKDPSFRRADFRNAIKQGFYFTDNEMRSDPVVGNCDAGATTIVALITPEDVLYVGNAGDCRAVLCSAGEAVALSMDHKPTLPSETARIKRAGGVVEDDRVEGDLAVSRALGDFEYKSHPELPLNEQMVSPEPDVVERKLSENDEFLILACDGIWDCISNKDAVEFVRVRLAEGLDLDAVAAQLMDRCIAREPNEIGIGCDNMTVVLVGFLMGKPRKTWRDIIKKRLTSSGSPVAIDDVKSLPDFTATSSQSHIVDTLPRGGSGAIAEVSMPSALPAGSYVDGLTPGSATSSASAYVDTLARAPSGSMSTSGSVYVDTLKRGASGSVPDPSLQRTNSANSGVQYADTQVRSHSSLSTSTEQSAESSEAPSASASAKGELKRRPTSDYTAFERRNSDPSSKVVAPSTTGELPAPGKPATAAPATVQPAGPSSAVPQPDPSLSSTSRSLKSLNLKKMFR